MYRLEDIVADGARLMEVRARSHRHVIPRRVVEQQRRANQSLFPIRNAYQVTSHGLLAVAVEMHIMLAVVEGATVEPADVVAISGAVVYHSECMACLAAQFVTRPSTDLSSVVVAVEGIRTIVLVVMELPVEASLFSMHHASKVIRFALLPMERTTRVQQRMTVEVGAEPAEQSSSMSVRSLPNSTPRFVVDRAAIAPVVMVPAVEVVVDVCSWSHQLFNVPIAHYALSVAAAYRE